MTRSVLVTGVSSGIGRLTAELMASRGWRVAGTSRDPAAIETWAAQHGIAVLPLELGDEASTAGAAAAAVERLGGLDVLVNNAGYGLFGPVEGATPEQVEEQFRVNVLGLVSLIRHVLPVMRARGGGTIVNVSSLGGRAGFPMGALYYASKFAVEGFSESLRYEAALHGVRVKLVEPGHFRTGFLARSLRLTSHPAYAAAADNYMAWARREDAKAPTPEPVAKAILRAAGDRSARLRYPVNASLILAMIRILPDALWRPLMMGGLTRRPKGATPAPPA